LDGSKKTINFTRSEQTQDKPKKVSSAYEQRLKELNR